MTGVPFFVFDESVAVFGFYLPERGVQALKPVCELRVVAVRKSDGVACDADAAASNSGVLAAQPLGALHATTN